MQFQESVFDQISLFVILVKDLIISSKSLNDITIKFKTPLIHKSEFSTSPSFFDFWLFKLEFSIYLEDQSSFPLLAYYMFSSYCLNNEPFQQVFILCRVLNPFEEFFFISSSNEILFSIMFVSWKSFPKRSWLFYNFFCLFLKSDSSFHR
jgi:hypothetical protein